VLHMNDAIDDCIRSLLDIFIIEKYSS
jgi:hypothetical protein